MPCLFFKLNQAKLSPLLVSAVHEAPVVVLAGLGHHQKAGSHLFKPDRFRHP